MGNRAKIASVYSMIEPMGALAGTQRTAVRFGGRLPAYYVTQAKADIVPKQVAVDEAAQEILRCTPPARRPQLTLTGGEPLFYADWITRLAKRIPDADVLLKTEGLQTKALAQVLPFVDLISLHWDLAALDRLLSARQDVKRSLQLIGLRTGEVVLHVSAALLAGDGKLLSDSLATATALLADSSDNNLPIWLAVSYETVKTAGADHVSLTAPLFATFPQGRVFFYN